jgi:hypothetical protein
MTGAFRRALLAGVLLIPVAAVDLRLGQPFAFSAVASTAAIVLHAPHRFQRRPQTIIGCYVVALAVAVPITLGGAIVAWPALITAAVAAALIVATPAARIHPPVACIPLAIVATTDPVALATRWALFVGTAAYCLTVLWIQTLSSRRAEDHSGAPAQTQQCQRRDATHGPAVG